MTESRSVPREAAPAVKKAAPAKKAPAKKAAPAAKKAAPAKAVPAKKAPARKRLAAMRKRAAAAPGSRYFDNARQRARNMINDPEALRRVADESYNSGAVRSGRFDEVKEDFRTLVRLVVAYGRGNYRDITADSLVIVVGGLIYVVSPVDLIPDTIPVAGYIDDVVVVRWVIKAVNDELQAFRAWELGQ